MDKVQLQDIVLKIKSGRIGVIPTDTIYGIVASVRFPESIEKVYRLTKRPQSKPFILLISDTRQLKELGISINDEQRLALSELWPGAVSAILPCVSADMEYLHRGTKTLAVRLPDLRWLRDVVEKTGPIIATSANMSGEPTPDNIADIKTRLPGLDFYVAGETGDRPSKLVKIEKDGAQSWLER